MIYIFLIIVFIAIKNIEQMFVHQRKNPPGIACY